MKIERSDDFGGAVLNCAVRYALGRMSYMPKLVIDEIKPMLKGCSDKTLWCFDKDISGWLQDEYIQRKEYETEWREFLKSVRAEVQMRKEGKENEKDS